MRVGLTCDQDSRSVAATTGQMLCDQGANVVCIGCAKDLVDKLAAGDRFDLVVSCCGHAAVPTLAELYEMPVIDNADLVVALESGKSLADMLDGSEREARRPHMLQMAGAKGSKV